MNVKRVLPVTLLLAFVALWYGVRKSAPEAGLYHGTVEAQQYEMGFEVGGRLEALEVEEGQRVEKGQLLGRLHQEDFQAALAGASARAQAQESRLKALRAGSRPQEIGQAQARVEQAEAEFERLRNGATQEQLDQAQARMREARQRWELTREGSRDESIEAARAELQGARSDLTNATNELGRYSHLYKEGAVSASTFESFKNREALARSRAEAAKQQLLQLSNGSRSQEIEAAHQAFAAQQAVYQELARGTRPELLSAARAELEARRQQLRLVEEGPRAEDIQAAEHELEQARAQVEEARLRLEKTSLQSPINGVVLRRNLEPGEMVPASAPVLTLVDLDAPWIEIFVPETEIGQVSLGDPFQVTTDSLEQAFPGKVSRVFEKAEYTPKQIQTERERVNLVFRVKVAVENPEGKLKPGMPADVRRGGL